MTGKFGIDKAAAGRFIKHAIAQAKNAHLVDEPSDAATATATATAASSSSNHERVPVKVTSKMMARAEYEKELKELGSEEEEDLEVFDEEAAVKDDEAMITTDDPPEETRPMRLDKGKGRASEEEQSKGEQVPSSRRKRPRVDPFSGEPPSTLSKCHPGSDDAPQGTKIYRSLSRHPGQQTTATRQSLSHQCNHHRPTTLHEGRLSQHQKIERRKKLRKRQSVKQKSPKTRDSRGMLFSYLLHVYTLIFTRYTDVDYPILLVCST